MSVRQLFFLLHSATAISLAHQILVLQRKLVGQLAVAVTWGADQQIADTHLSVCPKLCLSKIIIIIIKKSFY